MFDYRFGYPLLAGVSKAPGLLDACESLPQVTEREEWPSVAPLGEWERGPMPTHVGDVVVTPTADARWFWMWVVTDDAQQAPTAGQWLRHVEGLERVKAAALDQAGKDRVFRVFFFAGAGWAYWR